LTLINYVLSNKYNRTGKDSDSYFLIK